mgnify:CR=1 FL=1
MISKPLLPDFHVLFDAIANDLRAHGYSMQSKALPEQWLDGLLRDMHALGADQLKPAGVGRAQQHVANANIRRDAISWIESTEGEQGQWLAFSAQLQQHLNRSLMLGLFSFESHFAHYAPGAFYKTHVDAFKGQANRVLSVVLYLNPVWGFGDGGGRGVAGGMVEYTVRVDGVTMYNQRADGLIIASPTGSTDRRRRRCWCCRRGILNRRRCACLMRGPTTT